MKIEYPDRKQPKLVKFSDLRNGATFEYEGKVFMKVFEYDAAEADAVVRLDTACVEHLDYDAPVKRVNVVLSVTEY